MLAGGPVEVSIAQQEESHLSHFAGPVGQAGVLYLQHWLISLLETTVNPLLFVCEARS